MSAAEDKAAALVDWAWADPSKRAADALKQVEALDSTDQGVMDAGQSLTMLVASYQ
jgi:hypothetical protein